jgi:hypothetical protein
MALRGGKKMDLGGAIGGEGGGIEGAGFNLREPSIGQMYHRGDIQALVDGGEFLEISARQLEQGGGWCGTAFLQMHERAGQLDEALVEMGSRIATVGQPEFFKDFVGFVEQLAVEALEEGEVMGVEVPSAAVLNEGRDSGGFIGH